MASSYSRSAPPDPPPSRGHDGARFGVGESSDAAGAATQQMVRSYLVWPARNTFCCWGHCMTGPPEDLWPNACAWGTILVPMALFLYTWGGTLMQVRLSMAWWGRVASTGSSGCIGRRAPSSASTACSARPLGGARAHHHGLLGAPPKA